MVGLDIYNNDNKNIGTIKDIAMNPSGRTFVFHFPGIGVNVERGLLRYVRQRSHVRLS